MDLTKVRWLEEEEGICFQSAVEHYRVDIGSKLFTLHFLWFIEVEIAELKIVNV